jgi:hypothetical protein
MWTQLQQVNPLVLAGFALLFFAAGVFGGGIPFLVMAIRGVCYGGSAVAIYQSIDRIASELNQYLLKAPTANTDAELDQAAQHLANALGILGSDLFVALLLGSFKAGAKAAAPLRATLARGLMPEAKLMKFKGAMAERGVVVSWGQEAEAFLKTLKETSPHLHIPKNGQGFFYTAYDPQTGKWAKHIVFKGLPTLQNFVHEVLHYVDWKRDPQAYYAAWPWQSEFYVHKALVAHPRWQPTHPHGFNHWDKVNQVMYNSVNQSRREEELARYASRLGKSPQEVEAMGRAAADAELQRILREIEFSVPGGVTNG